MLINFHVVLSSKGELLPGGIVPVPLTRRRLKFTSLPRPARSNVP